MNNNETKQVTPPYLSLAKLQKTIDILSARSFSEVSAVLFTSNGFSKLDAQLAISTLKFLGLVDENGRATEQMPALRLKGDARKESLGGIVRSAYKKLFDTVDAPQNLSTIDLANAFHAHYPKLSDRVIRTAMPVFIKLCEYGGLKEEGSVVARTIKPREKNSDKKQPSKKTPANLPPTNDETLIAKDFSLVRVAEGRLVLGIPKELKERLLDDETLEESWRTVRSALREFADAHIPKTKKDSISEERESSV